MKKIYTFLTLITFAMVSFAQPCSDLFISEYVEGTGNNKALEIFNPTNNPISLANYRVIRHDNGNAYTEPIPDEAVMQLPTNITMAPKSVYVIALNLTDPNGTGQNAPIDPVLQAIADTLLCPGCATGTGQSRVMCFNGDDALALQKKSGANWVNIDIFACIGERPSNSQGQYSPTAGWTILPPFSSMPADYNSSVQGPYFLQYWTQDKTLLRKYEVSEGVKVNPAPETFNASLQWDSLPQNTFFQLGTHDCICITGIEEKATIDFKIMPNPAKQNITITSNDQINTIQLFDIAGRREKEVIISQFSNIITIDLTDVSEGVHLITATDKLGKRKTMKFIKQ